MRLLVTGASGLVGSNVVAAAVQRNWSTLGTWCSTQVRLPGAHTACLDLADRRACVTLASEFEPEVLVHAAASVELGRLEREPRLARLNSLGTEHTLVAARAVHARYVLVSSDWVFSGDRPAGQCWSELDPTGPVNAYGRTKLASELAVEDFVGSWLITRPANVYGVNLSLPGGPAARAADGAELHARHVWERSSLALRWVAHLRAGRPLPAPDGVYQSPTYACDYAERLLGLIARGCEGVCNTAGPDSLGRRDYLRELALAFDCDPGLVHDGSVSEFLVAAGEHADLRLPSNTTLCDELATSALGGQAVDSFTGHRLMREQLQRVLADRPAANRPSEEVAR
ncbi:MAG TPA: sugar nucleotide-binding protein [Solirubrobacteraceae bacterium]|jgi:dTDP-4-dehydrorhamnose reductase|nr:sugar nucleotide-binding protein [Solirubrobacteraceae bacterium]